MAAAARIDSKNRRTRKTKQMILLESLGNGLVHIAKLRAVALVKNNNYMLTKEFMTLLFLN